jgi:hypothetical protein
LQDEPGLSGRAAGQVDFAVAWGVRPCRMNNVRAGSKRLLENDRIDDCLLGTVGVGPANIFLAYLIALISKPEGLTAAV